MRSYPARRGRDHPPAEVLERRAQGGHFARAHSPARSPPVPTANWNRAARCAANPARRAMSNPHETSTRPIDTLFPATRRLYPPAHGVRGMFERRSDLVGFLAVVETGGLGPRPRASRHGAARTQPRPGAARTRSRRARLFEGTTTACRCSRIGIMSQRDWINGTGHPALQIVVPKRRWRGLGGKAPVGACEMIRGDKDSASTGASQ